MLRNLYERLTYLRNLEEKKEQVLKSIEEQGKLTDELKERIVAAETMVVVDDLQITQHFIIQRARRLFPISGDKRNRVPFIYQFDGRRFYVKLFEIINSFVSRIN